MKLYEIVRQRAEKQNQLSILKKEFEDKKTSMENQIKELMRLEGIGENNIDLDKVQLAETVLNCSGNIYGKADTSKGAPVIAELAIIDIANGCAHLKKQFFGNKTYSGYYQRCDCNYGYGPSHGGIVDEVGLKQNVRDRDLSENEKDACIYYLKNYNVIAEQKKKLVTA